MLAASLLFLTRLGFDIDVKILQTRMIEALESERKAHGFPGVTAAIVLPDGRLVAVAVGSSEPYKPMKTGDRMLAGSIGKTYFAATMLQIANEHNISLDTKISTWFAKEPWFSRMANHDDITLRHLMHHQSGLADYLEVPSVMTKLADPNYIFKGSEWVETIADMPALAPAGTQFAYTDLNFILVAMIIEKITGKKAYDEIDRRILRPLRLRDTIPSVRRQLPGLVQGNSKPNPPFTKKGPVLQDGKVFINPQMEWGGGGFLSNSSDLARWAQSLYGGNVLSPNMLASYTDGVPSFPRETYGLGCQLRQSNWGPTQGHSGWFPGYLSDMAYFPDRRFSVSVQFNSDDFRQLGSGTYRYVLLMAKQYLELKGKP